MASPAPLVSRGESPLDTKGLIPLSSQVWIISSATDKIHTCRLCAANPLNYLNALQRQAKEAREHPTQWFPWNYKQAIPPHDTG